MTREELFAAIGMVEESRLERTEMPDTAAMGKSHKRVFRNFLIAAIIVSMLSVTAYAAVGYLIFDSPEDMISTIFGNKTGFDHSAGSIQPDPNGPPSGIIVEPTFDRVPADEEVVASEAAPLVDAVGQSVSWEGYTLTVDANLYDSVTKCGMVTYLLEKPDGLDEYKLHSDGEIWSGINTVEINQYGYPYIIQERTTDTCLAVVYYYQLRNPETTDLEISLSEAVVTGSDAYRQARKELKEKIKQEVPEEEAIALKKEQLGEYWDWYLDTFTREEIIDSGYEDMLYERIDEIYTEEMLTCPDKIIIPEASQGEMTHITLGDGAVTLSPIAATVRKQEIENLGESFMGLFKICFADGSEYVVQDGYIENRVFAVTDSAETELTYMFNRIIDVKEVASVIVDGGVELMVD